MLNHFSGVFKENQLCIETMVINHLFSICHDVRVLKVTPTVAMSIDAVASSMIRMLLFLTKARAKQKSCL